jgi:octaprenyl-diphosphate synthase
MPQTFATQKKELLSKHVSRQAFDLVSVEMSLVEKEFERQASSNIQVIDYLGDYIRSSGGKRVRPALLVLASYAAGGDGSRESVIRLATVMEMLHTATLVHDDIIDNADLRRRRPSVNARFGNQTAVLMGDWLYMSAFETTLRERSLEILDIITCLTRKMTEGELIQLTAIGRLDITESEYLDILRRKTAYLFSACCEVGAILGGADNATQTAMAEYGLDLGIAFQLSDDLLDVTADTHTLGKTAGSDLLEGKFTLPFIYLLQEQPALKAKLEQVMLDGDYDAISRDDLVALLNERGILKRIKQLAGNHSSQAKKSLELLPETEYRSCLEAVLTFVIDRNR